MGSNPTSPIEREWSRHKGHYHYAYRIQGRVFSRRDSDPLIAFRGSGVSTAAVAGMLVFTSLALLGIRRIGLGWLNALRVW